MNRLKSCKGSRCHDDDVIAATVYAIIAAAVTAAVEADLDAGIL